MTIPERFAGRADGTEWRGTLQDQTLYRQLVERFNTTWPPSPDELCRRNAYCVLAIGHSGDCLAFMLLQNIPRDPTLPPLRQAPETSV